ncbi:MAG: hypothetical protein A2741_02790 [Candidatus Zambryskibacteria bacterium RIFCSPHIGHO2_01_FULL_43_27]|uniref:Uncharacterized protein n=1 Tax=Candidatus Zambryskibacteria bacterium RIFCSPLOWO2_01_FULL_43_17 TaxID=1802760 RepID=A0A1G2U0E4_9BACT|nr:MAG: hypothetical protein A2741_02790 [Candidatus Zambryskibacteria bacterium RIFCSPHIGHO2_01_FULL_43_27]OHB00584.1 MAG: hypothetical protein A3E93_03165 [Candidatus Zambryskibacteria bacterium RIFCSPHIGHO2_12_FULL_43_12b]OHB03008.1 MAG: hypothetical protein A2920_02970 [Candidatus Zambryskibacteria bacterium RIFCSPLOWO2_01_FULL_43_17]
MSKSVYKTPLLARAWFWPFPSVPEDWKESGLIETRWWAKVMLAAIDALIFAGFITFLRWVF